jgi:hypothetical protein
MLLSPPPFGTGSGTLLSQRDHERHVNRQSPLMMLHY